MWKLTLAGVVFGITAAMLFIVLNPTNTIATHGVAVFESTPIGNHPPEANTNNEAQQTLAKLNEQIQHLSGQVQALQSQSTVSDTSTKVTTQSNLHTESDLQQAQAAEQSKTEQTVQFLETRLQEDPLDPGWSSYAESEVAEKLMYDATLTASRLGDVHCQSTLCKMSVSHEDSRAELDFITDLGQMGSFLDGQAFVQRIEHEDGSIETVVFVSRTGYELPPMSIN